MVSLGQMSRFAGGSPDFTGRKQSRAERVRIRSVSPQHHVVTEVVGRELPVLAPDLSWSRGRPRRCAALQGDPKSQCHLRVGCRAGPSARAKTKGRTTMAEDGSPGRDVIEIAEQMARVER